MNRNIPFPRGPGGGPPRQQNVQFSIDLGGMLTRGLVAALFRHVVTDPVVRANLMTSVCFEVGAQVDAIIAGWRKNPQFSAWAIDGTFDRMGKQTAAALRQMANQIAACEVFGEKIKDDNQS